MNKISDAFARTKALIGFLTAGDPNLETTKEIMKSMASSGCDLIEIGIPFSDPIAEGEIIQGANIRALKNSVTTDDVFKMTKEISSEINVPLVYMTYLNVLFKYGYKKFLENAWESGVSGVIIPDMPYEEKAELQDIARIYGIEVISIIAPASESRIEMISKDAEAFVYAQPSLKKSSNSKIISDAQAMVKAVKKASNLPVAVNCNISTPEQAKEYCKSADAVIIDSAIVKIIAQYGEDSPKHVSDYIKDIKTAIK